MDWEYYILDESLFFLSWHKDRVEQDLQYAIAIAVNASFTPLGPLPSLYPKYIGDITQRGCAYLCAVAQHTVRYLKLWTFGIGGVWGGGGAPLWPSAQPSLPQQTSSS